MSCDWSVSFSDAHFLKAAVPWVSYSSIKSTHGYWKLQSTWSPVYQSVPFFNLLLLFIFRWLQIFFSLFGPPHQNQFANCSTLLNVLCRPFSLSFSSFISFVDVIDILFFSFFWSKKPYHFLQPQTICRHKTGGERKENRTETKKEKEKHYLSVNHYVCQPNLIHIWILKQKTKKIFCCSVFT